MCVCVFMYRLLLLSVRLSVCLCVFSFIHLCLFLGVFCLFAVSLGCSVGSIAAARTFRVGAGRFSHFVWRWAELQRATAGQQLWDNISYSLGHAVRRGGRRRGAGGAPSLARDNHTVWLGWRRGEGRVAGSNARTSVVVVVVVVVFSAR